MRFLRELEILGKLSHPALCRVFHAGFLPCGGERLPWFVMEYVPDALPITRFAETHDLSLRRRVELFRDVCDGVAAAHALGVASPAGGAVMASTGSADWSRGQRVMPHGTSDAAIAAAPAAGRSQRRRAGARGPTARCPPSPQSRCPAGW